MGLDGSYETYSEPIGLHLHELAEGLQATSSYLEALRHQVSQSGGKPHSCWAKASNAFRCCVGARW